VNDQRNFDTLTPEIRLRINGAELPSEAKADIISVTVLDDVNATGMFTFRLKCWDGVEMRVKWIDDDLFNEGNSVDIEMGYIDNMEMLFKGEITGLEPEFPKDEASTMTVRGYDRRHRLMGKHQTRTFLNMKDSDIAGQIAGDWSLNTGNIEDTQVTHEYVLQNNQTDFEFLQARARRIGYELVVSDRDLHFRPRQNEGSADVTLRREIELLDFNARLTAVGQVEEVFVQGWDPMEKQKVVAHSSVGDEPNMGGSASGPSKVQQVFGNTGGTTVDQPVFNQTEADQLSRGSFGERALHYVEGRGVCIGNPRLRAGKLVEIEGLGKRFSGTYYITTTEHAFRPSSGYRTTFTVRRNAT
jgi:phage protein D